MMSDGRLPTWDSHQRRRITVSAKRALLPALLALIGGACSEGPRTTAPESRLFRVTADDLAAAQAIRRPPEADFEDISKDIPEFGGYFLEGDALVAHISDVRRSSAARDLIRSRLASLRAKVGPQFSQDAEVVVRPASYSFRQLRDWRDLAFVHVLPLEGVVALDLDERANRVSIGLRAESDQAQALERVVETGIPAGAVAFEVVGIPLVNTTLREHRSPFRGGLRINHTTGEGATGCTLGFNARWSDTIVLITNSHCTPQLWGGTGSVFYQPSQSFPHTMLGLEVLDPYYFECGAGWPDVDHCRYSDAAVVQYYAGVSHDFGRIYRTLVRAYGPNGEPGIEARTIDEANPFITITAKGSWPIDGSTVDKIGQRTGWTYGVVDRTCHDVEIGNENRLCGGRAHYLNRAGDSGSPVFVLTGWSPGTATLIGLNWGGNEGSDISYFSSMWALEQELGSLDVVSSPPPPPPPPPLDGWIIGPSDVAPYDWACAWFASVSGGSGSYTYQWSGVLSSTNQIVWGAPGSSGWLYLQVNSSDGQQINRDMFIYVDSGTAPCEG